MHITTSYQIMIINITCFCFRPRKLAHIRPYRGLCTFLGVSHITASYQIINIGTTVFSFGQENSHVYNPYRGFTNSQAQGIHISLSTQKSLIHTPYRVLCTSFRCYVCALNHRIPNLKHIKRNIYGLRPQKSHTRPL